LVEKYGFTLSFSYVNNFVTKHCRIALAGYFKTAKTRHPGQDIQDRKAKTRQLRQDSRQKTWDRIPGTGHPGQDN
jgi:hypothetical protein